MTAHLPATVPAHVIAWDDESLIAVLDVLPVVAWRSTGDEPNQELVPIVAHEFGHWPGDMDVYGLPRFDNDDRAHGCWAKAYRVLVGPLTAELIDVYLPDLTRSAIERRLHRLRGRGAVWRFDGDDPAEALITGAGSWELPTDYDDTANTGPSCVTRRDLDWLDRLCLAQLSARTSGVWAVLSPASTAILKASAPGPVASAGAVV